MNRQIKFRMWDGKMMFSDGIINYDNAIDAHNSEDGIDLMQYIGLKDKNGKEIYEGDILREPQNTSYKFRGTGKVVYESDYGGFAVVGSYHKNQHHELLTCDVAHDCEVIGNIYENPDLLK